MRLIGLLLAALALVCVTSATLASGSSLWFGVGAPHFTFSSVTAFLGGQTTSCTDKQLLGTASTAIPVGQTANVEANAPPGANRLTRRMDVCGPLVLLQTINRPLGGDKTCTPGTATAVSYSPSGDANMGGNQVSDMEIDFYLQWQGSDSGVVACIEWYDAGTNPPTTLYTLSRVGPWSETITVPIVALTSASNIQFYASSEGYSIPGY